MGEGGKKTRHFLHFPPSSACWRLTGARKFAGNSWSGWKLGGKSESEGRIEGGMKCNKMKEEEGLHIYI